MGCITQLLKSTSQKDGKYMPTLAWVRTYMAISTLDLVFAPIRKYVIVDSNDPIVQASSICFLHYALLLGMQISIFFTVKMLNGKYRKLIFIVSVLALPFAEFEITSEVVKNSLFSFLHLFILYPLICALLNDMNLNKKFSYIIESTVVGYILLRGIILNYSESKNFPIGITVSSLYTIMILLIQNTSSHFSKLDSEEVSIKHLQEIIETQNTILKELPVGIVKIEMHSNIVEFFNDEAIKLIGSMDMQYDDPPTLFAEFITENKLTDCIRDHNILVKKFDISLHVISKPILSIPKQCVVFLLGSERTFFHCYF